ncbi:MAG: hypothetical protein ACRDHW_06680 [Ktedonobacteraceae bacterium]
MGFQNPFKRRQRGRQDTHAILPPYPGYDWEACVAALQSDPQMTEDKFATLMGSNGVTTAKDPSIIARYQEVARQEAERRAALAQQAATEQSAQQPEPKKKRGVTIGPGGEIWFYDKEPNWWDRFLSRRREKKEQQQRQARTPDLPAVQAQKNVEAPTSVQPGKLNLVNYTPEQLMQHVDQELGQVHLGMPWPIWFKWQVGEIWSVVGPMALFAGTAGEVFFFIWNNTSNQSAWWVALSVLVTVCVLEFTFMVVSYQSDTIRNHIKTKPGGATDEDKKDMRNHILFWFMLAAGVAIGQVSFLIFAMQTKLGGNLPFLIAFSVGRSAFTLAGDFYSAFVHKEKPTSGERTKSRLKQKADLTADLLKQKAEEVTIINNGTILLHQAHTEAEIKMDKLTTTLEIEKLQNRSQVDTMKLVQGQATMFTDLSSGIIRALFDPKMSDGDRSKLLGTMQALMGASALLPSPHGHTEVEEEKGL